MLHATAARLAGLGFPVWVSPGGDVVLVNGDCLRVLPELEAGSVDAVVTDFPYGVDFRQKTSDYRGSDRFDNGQSLRASVLYQDSREYVSGLVRSAMPLILSCSNRALVFCGPAMIHEYPPPAAIGSVFLPNGAGRCSWGFQCFQPILYYGKDPYITAGMGGRPNSFRTEQPNKEAIDHPCPKPLPWMVWAVNRASFGGELVCDPMMGSATTAIACLRTGRRFLGIEIDETYYRLSIARVERELGRMPLFAEKRAEQKRIFEGE